MVAPNTALVVLQSVGLVLSLATFGVALASLIFWWEHGWDWLVFKLPPILAIFLFSGPSFVYYLARLAFPDSASVKKDCSILSGFFLNGILSSTISTVQTGELNQLGLATTILSWILTMLILGTALFEAYYVAKHYGSTPGATQPIKLPDHDDDDQPASPDLPDTMDSDAVGALFVTTSGSVVQPYDALVALRIAGAVIAVISLIAAILSLHHSSGGNVFVLMSLILAGAATVEHLHYLVRLWWTPSYATAVVTDTVSLGLLCIYGLIVGVAELVTDNSSLGVFAWFLALTMFITVLLETFYTTLHYGGEWKAWWRSFHHLAPSPALAED
ncbi:uncharacterized protein EHS24_008038 [Apiotrichum porosum]|uniref:MARVEL domain-containing protein n=1 Tax=Apiotrichum porosum TaxID=105984 RepID=A0A427XSQ7_9TREE|nr:uncharacterized protein EHS24_008038 [Apiotrichum porosum]RSH81843.1 hypothetical protein EHS24_008038 [Apiotrichum porosum]